MGQYAKLLSALVGVLVTWGSTYYTGTAHWVQLVTGLLTAFAVYQTPNTAPTASTPPPAG